MNEYMPHNLAVEYLWSSRRLQSFPRIERGYSSICGGGVCLSHTQLHPRSGEKLLQSRQRPSICLVWLKMSFERMSLAAVRWERKPGISAPSRIRWHLRSETDYKALQRLGLGLGLFHLSLSICLVGPRGFERMLPVAVRLASPLGISALSPLLLVAAKQLVREDSTRDGLLGWWRSWKDPQ